MTRDVHAILIDGAPEFTDVAKAVAALADLLKPEATVVQLAGDQATRANLDAAIAKAATLADGALFVLAFVGHGVPADRQHPYQAWALHGGDVFTDLDLADVLRGFQNTVETVVISAACYGGGFFIKGPRRLDQAALTAFVRDLHRPVNFEHPVSLDVHLSLRFANASRTALLQAAHRRRYTGATAPNLICLSAAGYDDATLIGQMDVFVQQVVEAAEKHETYHQLSDRFDAIRMTGYDYQVDGRPSRVMNDVVLDVE